MPRLVRRVLLAVLAVAGLASIGCTTNKATGRSHLNLLSSEQEIAMGTQYADEVKKTQPVIKSGSVPRAVDRIGKKLAALSEEPDLPWEFTVIDDMTVNAFALPGGKIFIYRGLLEDMTNEAQLAAVLGHEIGHVTGEHADRRYQSQVGVGLVVAGVGAAAGFSGIEYAEYAGVAANAAGGLTISKWSRDDESEADMLGLRYMTAAGYNPEGMVQLMEILDNASGGGGVEWTATHPLPKTRIDRTSRIIQADYAGDLGLPFHEERFDKQVGKPLKQMPAPKAGQADTPGALAAGAGDLGCGCAVHAHAHASAHLSAHANH
ncbi:MAG: M48 family metallopeptidase [Planctomycetota bacterium]